MKNILAVAFIGLACGSPLPVAEDPEPESCDENYPHETSPDTCESNSYGTCCSWTINREEEGTCRYDYCTYHEDSCEWTLTLKECE